MKQRIGVFLASLLTLAACESRRPQIEPTPSAPAAALRSDTLEADQFCLPRQCGRIPICTANSVARCTPDNGCHWQCVPLNQAQ